MCEKIVNCKLFFEILLNRGYSLKNIKRISHKDFVAKDMTVGEAYNSIINVLNINGDKLEDIHNIVDKTLPKEVVGELGDYYAFIIYRLLFEDTFSDQIPKIYFIDKTCFKGEKVIFIDKDSNELTSLELLSILKKDDIRYLDWLGEMTIDLTGVSYTLEGLNYAFKRKGVDVVKETREREIIEECRGKLNHDSKWVDEVIESIGVTSEDEIKIYEKSIQEIRRCLTNRLREEDKELVVSSINILMYRCKRDVFEISKFIEGNVTDIDIQCVLEALVPIRENMIKLIIPEIRKYFIEKNIELNFENCIKQLPLLLRQGVIYSIDHRREEVLYNLVRIKGSTIDTKDTFAILDCDEKDLVIIGMAIYWQVGNSDISTTKIEALFKAYDKFKQELDELDLNVSNLRQ